MFTLESNVEICYFFWSVIDVLKTLVKGISKAMQHRGIWKHVFALYGFPARNLGPNEKKLMDIIGFQCKNYGVQRFMAILCAITKLISYNFYYLSSFPHFKPSPNLRRTKGPECQFVGEYFLFALDVWLVWSVDLLFGWSIFCLVCWSFVSLVDLWSGWFGRLISCCTGLHKLNIEFAGSFVVELKAN